VLPSRLVSRHHVSRLTFQMTHATDSDTNAERDYIINDLRKYGVIENVTLYKTGDQLLTENVLHYRERS